MKRRVLPTGLLSACIVPILLFGCSESYVDYGTDSESLFSESVLTGNALQFKNASPQQIYEDFMTMLKNLEEITIDDIAEMSVEELLEFGNPILEATLNTVLLNETLLEKLEPQLDHITGQNSREHTKQEHQELSESIRRIIRDEQPLIRELGGDDVKKILLDLQESGTVKSITTCSSMFNVSGGNVILFPGDQLNLANTLCPAGSYFYLTGGTYNGQSVSSLKNGNRWVGAGSWQAVLDGQGSTNRAFGSSNMTNNEFRWFKIRNYSSDGIFSGSGTNTGVNIENMKFENIAPTENGGSNGAVRFENCEDIDVSDSYFEDVAAGVLLTNCDGPLTVIDNEAMNPGRNFFQCDKCHGAGVRVNDNSMEHTTGYGNAVLEDWISIYDSEGTSGDYIQVNHNRARGHSNSDSGSFILLGDAGGKYQEAVGNIGVRPGQVGIGVAGGEYFLVAGNKMYSDQWQHSNVAYYLWAIYSPCDDHDFPTTPNPNIAHWRDSNGNLNRAWTDEGCGMSDTQFVNKIDEDTSMGPEIWNDW